MHLVVRRGGKVFNDYRFSSGPVYIGRNPANQVLLPSRTVSRQHAVIYSAEPNKWLIEDIGSSNRTYVNDRELIDKYRLKNGDKIRIGEYSITADLDNSADVKTETMRGISVHLDDTLTTVSPEPQVLTRRPGRDKGPAMRIPASRLKDFARAAELVCKSNGLDEIASTLVRTCISQFSAFQCFCALRSQSEGPMTAQCGKCRSGTRIDIKQLRLNDKINDAVENTIFMLFPQVPVLKKEDHIRSIMVAPLVSELGTFGFLYINNAADHEHYTISDLDYLVLLAIHTATIIENF